MIVNRFGLHVAPGNIPFLVQQHRAVNLISPDLRSPFELHIRPRGCACPHNIDLMVEADLPDWIDDPLVRRFLPIPRPSGERPVWVYDPDNKHDAKLDALCRLSTPVTGVKLPLWWRATNRDTYPHHRTNLGPIVWTGATMRQTPFVEKQTQLALAHDRRAIFVGQERLPVDLDRVEMPDIDLSLPFEAIGATALRRHMERIFNDS